MYEIGALFLIDQTAFVKFLKLSLIFFCFLELELKTIVMKDAF